MGSVPEERHRQAARARQLWQGLAAEAVARGWSPEERRDYSLEIIGKIEELCAPEIIRAVVRNWAQAGLCGVYIVPTQNPPYTVLWTWRENPEVIHAGIRAAMNTVGVSGVQFHEHVETCVTNNILEKSAELARKLRRLKPRALLEECNAATLIRTRFIVEHLREDQRAALSSLLFRELGGKPRLLRMDKEPQIPKNPTLKQKQAWLHWYIWCLRMHKPEMQSTLGGVPLVIAAADGDRLLTNKETGLPADPLGAIHVPIWRALGRELNRQGHSIKDPESESRIARSAGVSRDKLRSFPVLPIRIKTDGPGRIKYEHTGDDLLASIEASLRKKPTKSEDS